MRASPRAGRIVLFAWSLTAVATAACVLALFISPSAWRAAAALAAAGTLLHSFRAGRGLRLDQLRIGPDGAVHARIGDAEVPATILYCGPHFIGLGSRTGSLAAWPDSFAGASWRRLLVAGRWPRSRTEPTSTPPN